MTLAPALHLHQGASATASASHVVVATGLSIPVGRRRFARDRGCVIKDPSPPRAGQLVRCESVVGKAARVTQSAQAHRRTYSRLVVLFARHSRCCLFKSPHVCLRALTCSMFVRPPTAAHTRP